MRSCRRIWSAKDLRLRRSASKKQRIGYLRWWPWHPARFCWIARRRRRVGWHMIEALKDHPATQDIPVAFLYASGTRHRLNARVRSPAQIGRRDPPYPSVATVRTGVRSSQRRDNHPRVDDDPEIRELHTQIAQSALVDCRVLQAADGRTALEIMRQEPPALVLLDLMMPELDGMGVLAAMQQEAHLRAVPVIVLTAQTSHGAGTGAIQSPGGCGAGKGLVHRSRRRWSTLLRRWRATNAWAAKHNAWCVRRWRTSTSIIQRRSRETRSPRTSESVRAI